MASTKARFLKHDFPVHGLSLGGEPSRPKPPQPPKPPKSSRSSLGTVFCRTSKRGKALSRTVKTAKTVMQATPFRHPDAGAGWCMDSFSQH